MRTALSLLAVVALFSETASPDHPPAQQVSRSGLAADAATERVAARDASPRESSQSNPDQNRTQTVRKTPPAPDEGSKPTPSPTSVSEGPPHTQRTPVPGPSA